MRASLNETNRPENKTLSRSPAFSPKAEIFLGARATLMEQHAKRGELGLVPPGFDPGDDPAPRRQVRVSPVPSRWRS